jgi:hypothetical protein
MAYNNAGNVVDSSNNVAVDFVWGNLPTQPNDERADGTPTATLTVGGDQNVQWTNKSTIASARLNPALGNHADVETAWSGFPDFTANSAGEKLSGVYYISVPNVLGLTTALAVDALKDAGYEAANITTATAATNVAGSITDIDRSAGSNVARITGTGFAAAYPAGTKITIASTGTVDGTWTVNNTESTDKVYFVSNATTALSSGTGSVIGVAGTIKTQSTAADANSVLTSATITVTPWAAAS